MENLARKTNNCLVLQGDKATEYLSMMGISLAQIVSALEAGEIAAGNTSSFAPKTAAGQRRWLSTVERAREGLVESEGWTIEDKLNRPTSVSPNKQYTLAFVGGNTDTGVPSGNPKAARRKGRATAEDYPNSDQKIRYEATVLSLFSVEDTDTSGSVDRDMQSLPAVAAWVLLYHRDKDELRWEISLPTGFSREDKQFSGWDVRIIGPEVLSGNQLSERVPDIGGGDVDFEIA